MSGRDLKRIILEMGVGKSLHSEDYTKAARRAVDDAVHHSSISMFSSLGIDRSTAEIELTLAAQEPDRIDLDEVAKMLPFGTVTTKAVKGGLNVPRDDGGDTVVIVNAGIIVRVPL